MAKSYKCTQSTQGRRQWRGPMVPVPPPFKFRAPVSCFDPRLLHTSNTAFKNVAPVLVFVPTLLRNPGDGPESTKVPLPTVIKLPRNGNSKAKI